MFYFQHSVNLTDSWGIFTHINGKSLAMIKKHNSTSEKTQVSKQATELPTEQ